MPRFDAKLSEIYVQPGESHLVCKPVILRTLLGSCVGITFWVPRLGIAAICHAMLPNYPSSPPPKLCRADGHRYVDFAIRDLAHEFDLLGVSRREVQVKLFGGGDVLVVGESLRPTIGKLNCEVALKTLREEGFEVAASSLGGTSGLKIRFNTGTGDVLLQRLASSGSHQQRRHVSNESIVYALPAECRKGIWIDPRYAC
jgi:chemotaxis protein CheD